MAPVFQMDIRFTFQRRGDAGEWVQVSSRVLQQRTIEVPPPPTPPPPPTQTQYRRWTTDEQQWLPVAAAGTDPRAIPPRPPGFRQPMEVQPPQQPSGSSGSHEPYEPGLRPVRQEPPASMRPNQTAWTPPPVPRPQANAAGWRSAPAAPTSWETVVPRA